MAKGNRQLNEIIMPVDANAWDKASDDVIAMLNNTKTVPNADTVDGKHASDVLTTTSKDLAGAINEVKVSIDNKQIAINSINNEITELKKPINYSDLTGAPTSLPANGGNSDTVDGKHATETLITNNKDLAGAINEVKTSLDNLKIKNINYYVSPTGNDSNVGNSTQPFKTIQKAFDSIPQEAFDNYIINVITGDYDEDLTLTNKSVRSITIKGTGEKFTVNSMVCSNIKSELVIQDIKFEKDLGEQIWSNPYLAYLNITKCYDVSMQNAQFVEHPWGLDKPIRGIVVDSSNVYLYGNITINAAECLIKAKGKSVINIDPTSFNVAQVSNLAVAETGSIIYIFKNKVETVNYGYFINNLESGGKIVELESSERGLNSNYLSLLNGWKASSMSDGVERGLCYSITKDGLLHIRGSINPGTVTIGTVIAKLPTNLRIGATVYAQAMIRTNSTITVGTIDIVATNTTQDEIRVGYGIPTAPTVIYINTLINLKR